jgi:preprotein translocase subunit SecD
MQKLSEFLTITKPREKVDVIELEFKDGEDAKSKINEAFLAPFRNELVVVRSADGTKVTLTISNEVASAIRTRAVEEAKGTIHRRVDGLGVKEATVSSRDEDVIIEVPGHRKSEFQQIQEIISQTARLEFKLLDDAANFFETISAQKDIPEGVQFDVENAPLGPGKSQPSFYARMEKLPHEKMEETLTRFREWARSLPVDPDHEIGFEKYYRVNEETSEYEPVGWRTYYLWSRAELTGDMVRDAQAQSDQSDTGFGAWHVMMTLSPRGAELFERVTEANVQKRFAIILDNQVESAPVIKEKIGGGQARISMGGGSVQQQLDDARKLELVLRSGKLAAPIALSNKQIIGASLGQDAIDDGLRAAALASVLGLALMFMWYRRAGLIANVGLTFNLLLQLAVLSMFSASMTLPGIAGLALTTGLTVDANVLINERIREEVRAGKGARAAVAAGYDRAFSAIFDGNVTMLIAALIMAQYGTGPIKGFAVTLIIGMLTNLFTGVTVTRLLFEFWVRGRRDVKLGLA